MKSVMNGSGGSQREFPAAGIQGVPEIWVPFEGSIAVGW